MTWSFEFQGVLLGGRGSQDCFRSMRRLLIRTYKYVGSHKAPRLHKGLIIFTTPFQVVEVISLSFEVAEVAVGLFDPAGLRCKLTQ